MADFRIRNPARAYTRQTVSHARKLNLFFGLKILILNCVGLQIPYKAKEFCPRMDKLFVAMDFKFVAAYQRRSMKPFFPTEFPLRQKKEKVRVS